MANRYNRPVISRARRARHLSENGRHAFHQQVTRLHRVHPRLRSVHVGIAEVFGNLLRGERRGHHEDPQVGTKRAAHIHGHRIAEVARERTFVLRRLR